MRNGTSITWPLGSTGGTVLTRVVGASTEPVRTRVIVWSVGTSHGPGSRRAAQAPTGTNAASPTREYHHPPSCTRRMARARETSSTTGTRPATR